MAGLQGRGNAGCALVLLLGLLAFLHGAQATTHTVGGTVGWNYPPNSDVTWYDTVWQKNQTFHVGDVLLFNYSSVQHNVYALPNQTEYTTCNLAARTNTYDTGSDKIPLPTAGTYYYVCGIPGHCQLGMKVKVTVTAATTAPAPVVKAPTPAPAKAPVVAPAKAPVVAPVKAPVVAPPTPTPTVIPTPIVGGNAPAPAPGSPGSPGGSSSNAPTPAPGSPGSPGGSSSSAPALQSVTGLVVAVVALCLSLLW